MGTFWEAQEDNHNRLVQKYGQAVVTEMEKRVKDYRWDKVNYKNTESLRLREEAEGAQPWAKPYLPSYEELVEEMSRKNGIF